MRGVSTIIGGGDMLRDVAMFVQSLDSMFGGFQDRALKTYELLKQPGTQFAVVAAAEADALREAAFFVDRLSEETMPLAGLILNRTHPNLTSIHEEAALVALESVTDDLTRGGCCRSTPIAPPPVSANSTCCSVSRRPIRGSRSSGGPGAAVRGRGRDRTPRRRGADHRTWLSSLTTGRPMAIGSADFRRSSRIALAEEVSGGSDRVGALAAALGFEERRPRGDLGVLAQERATLTFGQATPPDTEFDAVV